jgi:hypothetical protein
VHSQPGPQRVADPVHAQHDDGDQRAGRDHLAGRAEDVLVGQGQVAAPARRGWLHAEAEEAEPALDDERQAGEDRRLHDHRPERGRDHVPQQDDPAAAARQPRG